MKNLRWTRYLVLLAAIVASAPAFAAREFYSISRSVRAQGMGGAFYGLSDDEYALFYNPAGLNLARDHRFNILGVTAAFNPDTFSAIKELSKAQSISGLADSLAQFQGQNLHGDVGVNLFSFYKKNFALGLLVPEAKFNFDFLGRDLSTQIDVTGIADAGLFLGFAKSFMDDKLSIGINAKVLVRAGGRRLFTLADIAQRNNFDLNPEKLGGVRAGVDFDLGATYELPMERVGPFLLTRVSLVLNNLLAPTINQLRITGNGSVPGTNRMLTLAGSTVLEGWGPFENFNVLLDFAEFNLGGETNPDFGARGGSFFKHVNVGVEAPMSGHWFTPRVGFHQGFLTAGFGIDIRAVRFDFAWYAEELAAGVDRHANRRLAIRLQLGWGSAPPAITRDAKKPEATPAKLEPTPGAPAPEIVQPPAGAPAPTDKSGTPQLQPESQPAPQLQEDKGATPAAEGPKPGAMRRVPATNGAGRVAARPLAHSVGGRKGR